MRLLAAVAAALLLAVAAPAAIAQQQQAPPERSITVFGEEETFADNDIATFRFGVTVRRPTSGAALRSAGAAVQRLIGALRASGVAREDIRTDVVSLERVRSRRTRRTVSFARNSVIVVVRRLADAGTIVDRAVRAGATNVFGPEFGVADAREVYRRTLGVAFAEARRKAERLAAESGVTLGPVLRVRESGVETGEDESAAGGGEARLGRTGSTPIAPGRSRISAAVTVAFAIQ